MKIEIRFNTTAPAEVVLTYMASHFGQLKPVAGYDSKIGNQLLELAPNTNSFYPRPGRWFITVYTARPSTVRHVLAVIAGLAEVSDIQARVEEGSRMTHVDFAGETREETFDSMAEKSACEVERLRAENARLATEVVDRDQIRAELDALRNTLSRSWLPSRLRKQIGIERRVARY